MAEIGVWTVNASDLCQVLKPIERPRLVGEQFDLSLVVWLQKAGPIAAQGGKARASVLSPEERKAIARTAALARWGKQASDSPVQPEKPATNVRKPV